MSMITRNHSEQDCHRSNNKRRKIIDNLKCLVECLQECDRVGAVGKDDSYPPQWAVPLITYPLTRDRVRKESRITKIPPWEKERKSVQILGGVVVTQCQCAKRDGLQADCKMTGCQGSNLCLKKPVPLCPNGGHANQLVSPEQAARILGQLQSQADDSESSCVPGETCRPECFPCSAYLKDICKYMPEWTE
ncbi:spermatid development [Nesidiocoris tenuis]|uniref:Spermatid development n=1 Tax=Nesidiocoris tenuis TaxID=355587 RepID=A0ABN7ASL5_9HEMI|nr:spermatid development [Nesidiocoris tenuis]